MFNFLHFVATDIRKCKTFLCIASIINIISFNVVFKQKNTIKASRIELFSSSRYNWY